MCVCVCAREGGVSKSCVCSLEASECYNWVNMSKWSMSWALGAGENCIFCTYGFGWTPSYSDNKHSAFALLKLQLNRIAAQPSSITNVSLRTALNLCLVGKLWVIGFTFASDADVNKDDEQRGIWLNALLGYRQNKLKGSSLIYLSLRETNICMSCHISYAGVMFWGYTDFPLL